MCSFKKASFVVFSYENNVEILKKYILNTANVPKHIITDINFITFCYSATIYYTENYV